jgi:hypothetical protein
VEALDLRQAKVNTRGTGDAQRTHGRGQIKFWFSGPMKWTLSVGQRIGENKLIYGRGWRGRGEAPPPPLGLS